MNAEILYERYQELQVYVGWTDADAGRVRAAGAVLQDCLLPLIEDFYEEIERHPEAKKVITGGAEQVERLHIIGTGFRRVPHANVQVPEVDQGMGDGIGVLLPTLDVEHFAVAAFGCIEVFA